MHPIIAVMILFKRVFAVRGAVCCENTDESIVLAVGGLYRALADVNGYAERDIVSVQFTATDDLTVLNPAAALRKAGLAASVPLFCAVEPRVKDYLPFVVRVLVTFYGRKMPKALYLNGAEALRPDLSQ